MAQVLEELDEVTCYVKNQGLNFTIPDRLAGVPSLDPQLVWKGKDEQDRAVFGLTASEAAVAAAVAAGDSLEVIAAARSVSVQTVRSQLKQMFGKTGTNRQSALVNRINSPLVNG